MTDPITVTGTQLIKTVKDIAAADPDFMYETIDDGQCLYVYREQPSCILGHALWRLGVINEDFESGYHNDASFRQVVEVLGLRLDEDDLNWLCDVQMRQDTKMPWGEAIKD